MTGLGRFWPSGPCRHTAWPPQTDLAIIIVPSRQSAVDRNVQRTAAFDVRARSSLTTTFDFPPLPSGERGRG